MHQECLLKFWMIMRKALWTPTITLGGGSTGMTYSRQEGHYTKIGRQVIGQFKMHGLQKEVSTDKSQFF